MPEHTAEFDAADLAELIRGYLLVETDCTRPSFHATALASRIAPHVCPPAVTEESSDVAM